MHAACVTQQDSRTVGEVIHNLPDISLQTVTSLVGSMGPSDFHCFGSLEKHLAGTSFVTDADERQAVTGWQQTLDTNSVYVWIQALVPQWDKCLNLYIQMGKHCSRN